MGGAATVRAVIFDLWETLVDWDEETSHAFQRMVAEHLRRDPDEFITAWTAGRLQRDTGTLAEYLLGLGVEDHMVGEFMDARERSTRTMLVPRAGVVETLKELRRRGIATGLISVCSEDVPNVWPETPFADLFDATVFSCSVRLRKPDPRIYLLACEQLGVSPEEALFVGDGANDELAGAERVGMRAVLIHRAGEEPIWDEVREWQGARITAIPQVLELLD
jgi:putative hydrolase of the HAD superfamily